MADTFTVVSQRETIGRLPDNSYGPVVRVTFRTFGDVVLSVDIPASEYTVDNVKAAIEARVQHANDISQL